MPLAHNLLHVGVRGEEGDDTIGHRLRALEQQLAVVAYGRRLGARVEFGREHRLVGAARHDERADHVSRKRHLKRLDDDGLDGEDLLVHVERGEGAGGDHD